MSLKYRNLPLLLLQARELVIGKFRHILNHYELTEQQWRIIRALSEQDAMEPRQICEVCQILSPSLAGVLARMEEVDLVQRSRVDSDQRRVLVSLTAKSRKLVRDMAPQIERQYRNLEAGIGADSIRELYQVLDHFLAKRELPVTAVDLPARGGASSVAPSERSPQRARGISNTRAKRSERM
jgi:homoprotocatechuate degradation regulator HpaR